MIKNSPHVGAVAAQLAHAWCLNRRVALLACVDGRCRQVQETLMLRYGFWQDTMPKPADVKIQGLKPPTRVQLFEHASTTHPAHSFRLKTREGSRQAECVRCGLELKNLWRRQRLVACLELPCSKGYQFAVLGVHCTHEPFIDNRRVRCRRCHLRQSVHSFASCNRFSKVCAG